MVSPRSTPLNITLCWTHAAHTTELLRGTSHWKWVASWSLRRLQYSGRTYETRFERSRVRGESIQREQVTQDLRVTDRNALHGGGLIMKLFCRYTGWFLHFVGARLKLYFRLNSKSTYLCRNHTCESTLVVSLSKLTSYWCYILDLVEQYSGEVVSVDTDSCALYSFPACVNNRCLIAL